MELTMTPLTTTGYEQLSWQKATASANNGCIEIAAALGGVAVRDSKNPSGPVLLYTRHEWSSFLDGAKKGEFDSLVQP